ncbi:MarR family protein [Anaerotignum neopropionicum]|uniref:MarR family protein n=1 Tax=Anaerotignum neopropionicum TaxID=36847 RepID=A0A136WES9_9FIRM|nr:MarR family transcriptional regulator [Anaerotignum neopropionicum]KXL53032.1 MarR family protein [Anaerotignum neopropionicum]
MDTLQLLSAFLDKQDLLSKLTESEKLHGFGYSDIHVISAIHTLDHANVTKIAEYMHITKSAISKIAKRLIKSGCILSYMEEYNKKEIYFRLTKKGEALNAEHAKRHSLWHARDLQFLSTYSEKELEFIHQFMQDYNDYLSAQIKELEGR